MWLAPLFAELLVWSDWCMKGTFMKNIEDSVLGGAGFNDAIFVFGLVTLISLIIYSVAAPRVMDWCSSKKSRFISRLRLQQKNRRKQTKKNEYSGPDIYKRIFVLSIHSLYI
jgi:hypothetical protein